MIILTYHKLSEEKNESSYTIRKKDIFKHLGYLNDNHYKCLLVNDLFENGKVANEIKKDKNIILTFDDGHKSDITLALPLLQRFESKATFFVTTNWIGKKGYMNEADLRELNAMGMSVQSHGKSHIFLDNSRLDLYMELMESKKMLEDILGQPVHYLSFPGGRYTDKVLRNARKVGFKAVFCSVPFYYAAGKYLPIFGRCMVKYSPANTNFYSLVNSSDFYQAKLKGYFIIKKAIRLLIGNNLYHILWKKFNLEST